MNFRQRMAELISNPATGRLSASDTALVGAFLATTIVLLWRGLFGQLDEWLFIGYLGAWVTQSQASKWQALKRDRVNKNVDESGTVAD